jgi:hypothetical protein
LPTFSNPCDFFLKEFYIPFNRTEKDEEKIYKLVESFKRILSEQVQKENESMKYPEITSNLLSNAHKQTPKYIELPTLIVRTFKNLYRNPNSAKVRLVQTVVIGLLMNLVFWDLGTSNEDVKGKGGL